MYKGVNNKTVITKQEESNTQGYVNGSIKASPSQECKYCLHKRIAPSLNLYIIKSTCFIRTNTESFESVVLICWRRLYAVSSCQEDMHREKSQPNGLKKKKEADEALDFSYAIQQVHYVSTQWWR